MQISRQAAITIRFSMWVFCTLTFVAWIGAGQTPKYQGPCDLVASQDGKILYVANLDAKKISFVDSHSGEGIRSIGIPGEPTGLTLSPDGRELYVTSAAAQSSLLVIDVAFGKVKAKIPAGHTACGP